VLRARYERQNRQNIIAAGVFEISQRVKLSVSNFWWHEQLA
jgi:hypothetical protein